MLNSKIGIDDWTVVSDDEVISFSTLDSALAYARGRAFANALTIERSEDSKVIRLIAQADLLVA